MADMDNSPGSRRSYIPRPSKLPSKLPLPAQSVIRQSPSRDSLRASTNTNTISVSRLRPSQSGDQLARTIAPTRGKDINVHIPQKTPSLRSKPSSDVFKKPLGRPPSRDQEFAQPFMPEIESQASEDGSNQDEKLPKGHRPSLSERVQETLAQIPPSPAISRRKSSFFNPESPMRPPSRSTNGSRPGSSYGQDGTMRPPSRQTASRPGSSAGYSNQVIPIDFRASTQSFKPNASLHTPLKRPSTGNTLNTPKSVSNLRLAASSSKVPSSTLSNSSAISFKGSVGASGLKSGSMTIGRAVRPRASINKLFDDPQMPESSRPAQSKTIGRTPKSRQSISGLFNEAAMPEPVGTPLSKTIGRTVRPRPSLGGLYKKPSVSEMRQPAQSPRGNIGMKKVSPTFSNASSTGTSTTSYTSIESISSVESAERKETTPARSSLALREQIAKAKAAKRAALAKQTPVSKDTNFEEDAPIIPTGTFDFGLDDPFNQNSNQDSSKGLLRKRIDAARTDGRLNIAAMGLKEIPAEVMNMYNLENVNGHAGSWAESVDLARFIAADNELETIGDDVFPDVDPRDLANDDDAQGNQFGGLETLDLHGNVLMSVPMGLRRLDLLTTLNLSNNKLGNDCFDVISQIPSLRDLKVANNSLSGELSSGLLRLSNLEVLDIHQNQLTSLPDGLAELVHLRFLNLSENAFPSLPFDALQGLPLTELFAAKNKLSGVLITLDAIEFPILRTLDVSANSLTSLSSGSLSLPSLQLLTISANRLTHLPPVSTWTSLLTLSAADNSIAALPEGFVDLPHLKLADLQGNALRILDDRIALMESLDTLLVSGNPLREKKFSGMNTADLKRALAARLEPAAPEPEPAAEIEEFQHTRNTSAASVISVIRDSDSDTGTEYLDAPSTPTLPRSPSASEWSINATLGVLDRSYSQSYSLNPLVAAQIAGENKIRSIELHHNAFSEVPASIAFFGLTLTSLNLSHNGLTSDNFVKDEIELPVLRELNLSSNTFNSLSPLLRYLKAGQLEKLDVSFNRLTTLPILRGRFPALAIVLASNNTIRELNPEAVRGLRSVDVGSNELGSLNPRLGLIKGLDRLEVGGNRFRVPGWRVLEKGTGSLLEWLRGRIPVGELEEEEREREGEREVD